MLESASCALLAGLPSTSPITATCWTGPVPWCAIDRNWPQYAPASTRSGSALRSGTWPGWWRCHVTLLLSLPALTRCIRPWRIFCTSSPQADGIGGCRPAASTMRRHTCLPGLLL